MFNFTNKELSVLNHLVGEGMDCTGAETVEDLMDDFMAFELTKDLGKAVGLSQQALGGVLQSLSQKKAVSFDENPSGAGDEVWLNRDEALLKFLLGED